MAETTNSDLNSNANPPLEIGPDGLLRESPAIAYTEKVFEEGKLQLKKYIQENYSKIRDVERELANLSMEMKLTAGPKKAALEHLRKRIEMSTERIRIAKLKEEQAQKALEAASEAVKNEEEIKQKLCDDLNNLVQESSNSQLTRLEELKRRLETLNPTRSSTSVTHDGNQSTQTCASPEAASVSSNLDSRAELTRNTSNQGRSENLSVPNGHNLRPSVESESRGKKKILMHGRGRGIGAVPKGRGSSEPGWTGAGFDVDGRN